MKQTLGSFNNEDLRRMSLHLHQRQTGKSVDTEDDDQSAVTDNNLCVMSVRTIVGYLTMAIINETNILIDKEFGILIRHIEIQLEGERNFEKNWLGAYGPDSELLCAFDPECFVAGIKSSLASMWILMQKKIPVSVIAEKAYEQIRLGLESDKETEDD